MVFDGAVILLERAAPRSNGAIEVVDGCEMLVDERLIDKGPDRLGQSSACGLGRILKLLKMLI